MQEEIRRARAQLDASQAAGGAAPQKEMDLHERHSLEARVSALSEHVKGYERSEAARQQRILALASQALREHAKAIRHGEEPTHSSLFALVGLWLTHGEALGSVKAELDGLPAHKLLPLFNQLACRLGPESGTPRITVHIVSRRGALMTAGTSSRSRYGRRPLPGGAAAHAA